MAKSYAQEHIDRDGNFDVFITNQDDYLYSAKLQSRHISSKSYRLWILYNEITICSWYCQCKSGSRIVGTCSHVTSVIWYLALGRHIVNTFENNRDWSQYLLMRRIYPFQTQLMIVKMTKI